MSTSASRRRRRGLVGAIELFWRPPALPLSASHLPPGLSSIDPPPSGASETLLFFSGYQPILSASFVSAAAVAAAHRLNNPLLSGRATPWKMKETAPRRLQSDHTLQQ